MEDSLYALAKANKRRFTSEETKRLKDLVSKYKRNPQSFDSGHKSLKPGTRLARIYNGKKHNVLVTQNGFEYNGRRYNSLSKIVNDMTGSRWNGW